MHGRFTNNFLPAGAWLLFHALVVRWDASFLSLLLGLRMLVVFGCLLIRESPTRSCSWNQKVSAWLSTILPTAMIWSSNSGVPEKIGEFFVLVGVSLFVTASLDLGKSFGISPAVRSRVSHGIYRYMRNPIYISHMIVEAGIVIAAPTTWNIAIICLAWTLYATRGFWESKILTD